MRSLFFGRRKFTTLKVALLAVVFVLSAGDALAQVSAGGTCTGQGLNVGTCAASCSGSNFGSGNCNPGLVCCGANTAGSCGAPNTCRSGACLAGETSIGSCPTLGQTCCAPGGTGGTPQAATFTNPLRFNTVEEVLGSLLGTLRGIIVVLSIVFIVIGAILYITSAGDEGRMKTAKAAITASMIGLALGIAAPSFLKEIGQILGWGAVNNTEVSGAKTLTEIATNVLNFLLSIVGILGIIMLVVGGIMYLTAAGDENRIDTGKSIVKYSIIGIIVALASLVLVSQIANFFL